MTKLHEVLARPEIQAKIEEGKRRIQDHREAAEAGKEKQHDSLLTSWDRDRRHQTIVENYISKVIAFVDQALASDLAGLPQEVAWSKLWQLEDKQGKLTKIADEYKRQFAKLIDSRHMEDSVHGGPLYFLFDAVCTKVAAAVFKLKFGES